MNKPFILGTIEPQWDLCLLIPRKPLPKAPLHHQRPRRRRRGGTLEALGVGAGEAVEDVLAVPGELCEEGTEGEELEGTWSFNMVVFLGKMVIWLGKMVISW